MKYTPEILTRQMFDTTHLYNEAGQCQKCGYVKSKMRENWGYLKAPAPPFEPAPLMIIEPCETLQDSKTLQPYKNLPEMAPGKVPEFTAPPRPLKVALHFLDGRYLKTINSTTYQFTRERLKATIFTRMEEMNLWQVKLLKIWGRPLNLEHL